ncbi:MAG: hypothetical protein SH819_01885 [Cytophagales bacterium]|nr:hypothetical protein [Cytophagales bacterium]
MRVTRILITVLLFGLSINSFGQKYYYYKPWKHFSIQADKIILTIDTVKSKEGKEFLDKIASQLSGQLNSNGLECVVTDITSTSSDKKTLKIKLSLLTPAYVKLETLGAKIPLCNRVTFQQIEPKTDKRIDTTLNISVDKEEDAISPLTDDLTKRILKQLTKK